MFPERPDSGCFVGVVALLINKFIVSTFKKNLNYPNAAFTGKEISKIYPNLMPALDNRITYESLLQ